MSLIMRTDEEIMALQNKASEGYDQGRLGMDMVVRVLDWLTDSLAELPSELAIEDED